MPQESVVVGGSQPPPRSSHEVPRALLPQVQLHLVEIINAKKSGAGHTMYKVCRRVLTGPIVAEDTYCLEVVGKELRAARGRSTRRGRRRGEGRRCPSAATYTRGSGWRARSTGTGQGKSTSCTGDVYEGEFQKDDYHGRAAGR